MTTQITINYCDTTNRAPLYNKYPRQSSAQDAYIQLDCRDGNLIATWNGEIGNAIPFSVYHGHDRRYSVPNNMSAADINALLDEIAPLAQRIVDGYDSRWDGNNNVAVLDEDAQAAEEELIESLPDDESFNGVEVWDVDEYLFSNCHLSDFWNTQTLEEAVAELENSIENNIAVEGDFEESLVKHAVEALDYRPARYLNRNHIKTLWKRGDINRSQVKDWLAEMK